MIEQVGNCKIVEEIGAGGMAVVYKAVQEPLGRTVAIKALKTAMASDKQFSARFMREAHFMASMQHENILHVYDFMFYGGTCFIILEPPLPRPGQRKSAGTRLPPVRPAHHAFAFHLPPLTPSPEAGSALSGSCCPQIYREPSAHARRKRRCGGAKLQAGARRMVV